jgi:hypothetical protein
MSRLIASQNDCLRQNSDRFLFCQTEIWSVPLGFVVDQISIQLQGIQLLY